MQVFPSPQNEDAAPEKVQYQYMTPMKARDEICKLGYAFENGEIIGSIASMILVLVKEIDILQRRIKQIERQTNRNERKENGHFQS